MEIIQDQQPAAEPPTWVELAIGDITYYRRGNPDAVSPRVARELLGLWGYRDRLSDEEFASVLDWFAAPDAEPEGDQ